MEWLDAERALDGAAWQPERGAILQYTRRNFDAPDCDS